MTKKESASFYRPCWADISTSALRHNWRAIKKRLNPAVAILAVVKANAYGHGFDTCARIAVEQHAAMLGVASLDEGLAVRRAGVQHPTLILGGLYPFSGFPLLLQNRLTPTIASLQAAEALNRFARARARRLPVHLKIDTGFGRIGPMAGSAAEFVRTVARMPGLSIEGLYTHFSSADIDVAYTRGQHAVFQEVVRTVALSGVRPKWIHEANSAAILRFPETHATMVRPGLAFYGIGPYPGAAEKAGLKPVLTWKSRVVYLKTVPAGFPVSYAKTWVSKRPTRIATLAVGYGDGYPRLLSNHGEVLLNGKRAPVIGRVTMDMIMVDATRVPDIQVGDEAVLIGTQGSQTVSADELAERSQTIPYEILCRVGARVPRVPR